MEFALNIYFLIPSLLYIEIFLYSNTQNPSIRKHDKNVYEI